MRFAQPYVERLRREVGEPEQYRASLSTSSQLAKPAEGTALSSPLREWDVTPRIAAVKELPSPYF